MTETATPHICDDHYYAGAILEESYTEEDDFGRPFLVARFVCEVDGCRSTRTETGREVR